MRLDLADRTTASVGAGERTSRRCTRPPHVRVVGIVPADAPRYVILVGVDNVVDGGGTVAAPMFAKIAAKALGR